MECYHMRLQHLKGYAWGGVPAKPMSGLRLYLDAVPGATTARTGTLIDPS